MPISSGSSEHSKTGLHSRDIHTKKYCQCALKHEKFLQEQPNHIFYHCSRGGRATASYSISPSASPPPPSRKSSIGFALEEEELVRHVISIVFMGYYRKSLLPKKKGQNMNGTWAAAALKKENLNFDMSKVCCRKIYWLLAFGTLFWAKRILC